MDIKAFFKKWFGWLRGAQYKTDTSTMTIEELEAEYREYHSQEIMRLSMSNQDRFRMAALTDALNSRGIYINEAGVDVYFLTKEPAKKNVPL